MQAEWARSRYWLCHFLTSRHRRPRVSSSTIDASDVGESTLQALTHWLAKTARFQADDHRALVRRAEKSLAHDPAFVQSLRLVAREREHHARLAGRTLEQLGVSPRPTRAHIAPLDVCLSVRFRLQTDLLRLICESELLDALREAPGLSTAIRDRLALIATERQNHQAFVGEWLTAQFAEFNTVRRNLRRLRLRVMFAAVLVESTIANRRVLRVSGQPAWRFLPRTWSRFKQWMAWLAPYRRDELLGALLRQREDPFALHAAPARRRDPSASASA